MSSDFGSEIEDIQALVQTVVPMGLTSNETPVLRNVGLTLSKALTYQQAAELFREDDHDPQVAQDSLVLLEMVVLMIEHWAGSHLQRDVYLKGLTITVVEVLVHSVAFWARLKQSAVIAKLLLQVQDYETDRGLRNKAVKVITALSKDQHS